MLDTVMTHLSQQSFEKRTMLSIQPGMCCVALSSCNKAQEKVLNTRNKLYFEQIIIFYIKASRAQKMFFGHLNFGLNLLEISREH